MTYPKAYYLDPELVHSKAFESLPGNAVKLYIYFLTKRALVPDGKGGYIIQNNGDIKFRYLDIPGMTQNTITRSIDHIIDKGLMHINVPGGKGRATTYFFSERWRLYGTKDFVPKKRKKRNQQDNQFPKSINPNIRKIR